MYGTESVTVREHNICKYYLNGIEFARVSLIKIYIFNVYLTSVINIL